MIAREEDFQKAIGYLLRKKWITASRDFARRTSDKTEKIATLTASAEEAMAFAASRPKSAAMQKSVLELMCSVGSVAVKELCYFTGASMPTIQRLEKLGFAVHGPELMEEYDLIANRMIKEGHTPVKKKAEQEQGVTAQFKELQRQGQALLEAIAHNKGGTNKDLKGFAAELEALIKKWDR